MIRRCAFVTFGMLLLVLLTLPLAVGGEGFPATPGVAGKPSPVPLHGGTAVATATARRGTSPAKPSATKTTTARATRAKAAPQAGTLAQRARATAPMRKAASAAGTPASQCYDLGDGAIDQNGNSVDYWAPGLRAACGFPGYENGDDPLPPGTLLPPPRPFRFDAAVDHNESVFGFKVFYLAGDPDTHCGDLRVILHMGGAPSGATTRFHTAQIAYASCDDAGVHIIDVAGQIDTGGLLLRKDQTGLEAPPQRETADTSSCPSPEHPVNLDQNFPCYTTWYAQLYFEIPGSGQGGTLDALPSILVAFQVDNPIALSDPGNLARLVPIGIDYDETTRSLGDWAMYNINTGDYTMWWTMYSDGVNRFVPEGTPGAWVNQVDNGLATPGVSGIFGQSADTKLTRHFNNVPGIVYPN